MCSRPLIYHEPTWSALVFSPPFGLALRLQNSWRIRKNPPYPASAIQLSEFIKDTEWHTQQVGSQNRWLGCGNASAHCHTMSGASSIAWEEMLCCLTWRHMTWSKGKASSLSLTCKMQYLLDCFSLKRELVWVFSLLFSSRIFVQGLLLQKYKHIPLAGGHSPVNREVPYFAQKYPPHHLEPTSLKPNFFSKHDIKRSCLALPNSKVFEDGCGCVTGCAPLWSSWKGSKAPLHVALCPSCYTVRQCSVVQGRGKLVKRQVWARLSLSTVILWPETIPVLQREGTHVKPLQLFPSP